MASEKNRKLARTAAAKRRRKQVEVVLVGTSLAAGSDELVAAALRLARAAGARLHLAHAAPGEYVYGPAGAEWMDAGWLASYREAQRRALDAQVERLGIAAHELAGATLEIGAPHRVLLDLARQIRADLLVAGATDGEGRLERLLGSTADRLIRKATCPVLVVRGELAVPPIRVLAAVDLSPLSADALRCGLTLLGLLGQPAQPAIEALFVLDLEQRLISPRLSPEQVDRFAAEELRRFVDRVDPEHGAAIETRVRSGDPREEIVRELAERPADLLVLGTHGLGGFERFVLGSVTADLVRRAPTSLLVVPPEAAIAAAIAEEQEAGQGADWFYVSDEDAPGAG